MLDPSIQRGLLNCSRQWGKSTVTAIKAVHQAYFHAGSTVIAMSPTERQSGEFLDKARRFARELGIEPRGDGHNRLSMAFPNGSRIVGLPGERAKVRGFSSISLMLIDEAAEVSEEAYLTVRPMLAMAGARGGRLWLMSTPKGKRGFFHRTWTEGGDRWFRVSVPATENPRISAEFLENERQDMSDAWFRQEYLCEFVETSERYIGEEDITANIRADIPPLWRDS